MKKLGGLAACVLVLSSALPAAAQEGIPFLDLADPLSVGGSPTEETQDPATDEAAVARVAPDESRAGRADGTDSATDAVSAHTSEPAGDEASSGDDVAHPKITDLAYALDGDLLTVRGKLSFEGVNSQQVAMEPAPNGTGGAVGATTGLDLTAARIVADPVDDTIGLVWELAGLPPTGGLPELVRYVWTFEVGGERFHVVAALSDVLASAASGDPSGAIQRVGGVFELRGDCGDQQEPLACPLLARLDGSIDTSSGTVTAFLLAGRPPIASGTRLVPPASGPAIYSQLGTNPGTTTTIDTVAWTTPYDVPERGLTMTVNHQDRPHVATDRRHVPVTADGSFSVTEDLSTLPHGPYVLRVEGCYTRCVTQAKAVAYEADDVCEGRGPTGTIVLRKLGDHSATETFTFEVADDCGRGSSEPSREGGRQTAAVRPGGADAGRSIRRGGRVSGSTTRTIRRGGRISIPVSPGRYSIEELLTAAQVADGWFTEDMRCTEDGRPDSRASSRGATASVDPGETVKCTIYNGRNEVLGTRLDVAHREGLLPLTGWTPVHLLWLAGVLIAAGILVLSFREERRPAEVRELPFV